MQHTCALKTASDVNCWGNNEKGQASVPGNLWNVTALAAGAAHTCAINTTGNVICWGGQGNAYYGQTNVPSNLGIVTAVATGQLHTCALNTTGQVSCWGYPQAIPDNLWNVTALAAGGSHTCAVNNAGNVNCWTPWGQDTVPSTLGSVTAVAVGGDHKCALNTAGNVNCWGSNGFNQTTVPSNLGIVTAVAAGHAHTCALNTAGKVMCWGHNEHGQTNVPGDLGFVTALATGGFHTIVITGTPAPASCASAPGTAPASATVPGSCSTGAHGATCTATCPAGFAGSPTSTCALGNWGAWSGSCTDQRCKAAQLPALPSNAVLAIGACDSSLPGSTCVASCAVGYSGSPTLSCKNDSSGWVASWTGSCTPQSCTAARPNTPANAIVPASCSSTGSGNLCAATCPLGFVGSPVLACNLGAWGTWNGSCTDQRCPSSALPRLPSSAALPTAGCNNAMPGASCVATCPAGFSGNPTIGCSAGNWAVDWTGMCIPNSVCQRSIPNCAACRFQFFRGSASRATCTQCAPSYVLAQSGRACWCGPGFAWDQATSSCTRCGIGSHCPGSRSTAASATRTTCPGNMTTGNDVATSSSDCWLLPGNGLVGGVSSPCPVGSFNSGFNRRACTRCPGGLTTPATSATSSLQCVAPPGSMMDRGKAVACAQGTFKAGVGNTPCIRCPAGWATAFNTTGATSPANCSFVMPGFGAPAGVDLANVTRALTRCPEGTFRAGLGAYTAMGVPCTSCGSGLSTLPGIDGAISRDACLVAPGAGFDAATGTAADCPVGSWNTGYNREPCTPCDGSANGTITTVDPRSTSSEDCVVLAGHGTTRTPSGARTGAPCPPDTFGSPSDTSGPEDVSCTKCLENTGTQGVSGATSSAQCVTPPGYGYQDGEVAQCEIGSWAAGGDQADCISCGGDGWTTLANASATAGEPGPGAVSAAQCAADLGYEYRVPASPSQGLRPCPQGFFKATVGAGSCQACPSGTLSTKIVAAGSLADCNVCRPGFGNPAINPSAPSCTACPDGFWSPGRVPGGNGCTQCSQATGYNGKMVSRAAVGSAEACTREFPSDAGEPNGMPYDILQMAPASLTVQPAITTVADCQAACSDSPRCTYYAFYGYNTSEPSTGAAQCFLRLQTANVTAMAGFNPASSTLAILFEVRENVYTAVPALDADDAAAVGTTLAAGLAWDAARAACLHQSACVGMAVGSASNSWRTFSGNTWNDAVGKVRVFGPTLNSWVPNSLTL